MSPRPLYLLLLSSVTVDADADARLFPKIDTAQNDATRIAFELHCKKLASRTFFDLVAQPHELRFALVRLDPFRLFQIVHRGCADGTLYLPLAVNHRKQDHHPVKFVSDKITAGQCHLTCLLEEVPALRQRRLKRLWDTPC